MTERGHNRHSLDITASLPVTVGDYTIGTIPLILLGRTIGEGTFGKVAVKILEKDRIVDSGDVRRVSREIGILKLLRHPYIIQLYEIIETPSQFYLITEYAPGGELFDFIVARSRLRESEARRFFHQIIAAVDHLHKFNVVHRDLKPENLLLDSNNNIKMVDFGLSNRYQPGELLLTACGSPCYAAPEMIAGKRYAGASVDIWSCGIVLFAMICGYLPFEDPNTTKLYKKIMSGDFSIPKHVSADAKDLLRSVIRTDPERRFTADDIRRHRWFTLDTIYRDNWTSGSTNDDGSQTINADSRIVELMAGHGFDRGKTEASVRRNRHNRATATYYLLLTKLQNKVRELKKDAAARRLPQSLSPLNRTMPQSEAANPQSAIREDDLIPSLTINMQPTAVGSKELSAAGRAGKGENCGKPDGDESFSFERSSFYAEKMELCQRSAGDDDTQLSRESRSHTAIVDINSEESEGIEHENKAQIVDPNRGSPAAGFLTTRIEDSKTKGRKNSDEGLVQRPSPSSPIRSVRKTAVDGAQENNTPRPKTAAAHKHTSTAVPGDVAVSLQNYLRNVIQSVAAKADPAKTAVQDSRPHNQHAVSLITPTEIRTPVPGSYGNTKAKGSKKCSMIRKELKCISPEDCANVTVAIISSQGKKQAGAAPRQRKKPRPTRAIGTSRCSQYAAAAAEQPRTKRQESSATQRSPLQAKAENEPARYAGAVSLSCVSAKKPQEVVVEVLKAIKTNNLKCFKVIIEI